MKVGVHEIKEARNLNIERNKRGRLRSYGYCPVEAELSQEAHLWSEESIQRLLSACQSDTESRDTWKTAV